MLNLWQLPDSPAFFRHQKTPLTEGLKCFVCKKGKKPLMPTCLSTCTQLQINMFSRCVNPRFTDSLAWTSLSLPGSCLRRPTVQRSKCRNHQPRLFPSEFDIHVSDRHHLPRCSSLLWASVGFISGKQAGARETMAWWRGSSSELRGMDAHGGQQQRSILETLGIASLAWRQLVTLCQSLVSGQHQEHLFDAGRHAFDRFRNSLQTQPLWSCSFFLLLLLQSKAYCTG